ncbi:hypothetical protein BM527_16400 [Alteromonas sp. Mex14]|nr:hypothetical protein BM527_16400 [Alteromonas sp. Mex14]
MQHDRPLQSFYFKFFSNSYFSIFIICAVGIFTYLNSLQVPFYLDDAGSITNNTRLVDASIVSLFNDYGLRFLGYVGFWLNYEYAKLDVVPYHVVNIGIHVLASMAVFALTNKLAEILHLFDNKYTRLAFSCFVALLFVAHPLQSQAVTYIVQRLASQVALFYIAALTCYLYFRVSSNIKLKYAYLTGAVVFGAAAIFTKQNAFTLPLVVLLCEWLLFHSVTRKYAVAVTLLSVVATALVLLLPDSVGGFVSKIDALSRETTDFSRTGYFLAQLPILWNYIGKVFVPWPLQLEYDYTVDGFALWQICLAALAHIALLFAAVAWRKKYPVVTWGVLFYYATHLIESGVIPITDIAFEHRTYLPNLGLFIAVGYAVVSFLSFLVNRSKSFAQFGVLLPVLLLTTLVSLTILRNEQWKSPELLLANDLKQAPNQARAIHNYAEHKLRQGEVKFALELLERLYQLDIQKIDAIMLNTHLAALIEAKQFKLAIEKGEFLLEQNLNQQARAIINSNMGIMYTNLQKYSLAEQYFDRAYGNVSLPSNSLIAYAYVSFVLANYDLATTLCKQILSIEPKHRKALLLLNMIDEKIAGVE